MQRLAGLAARRELGGLAVRGRSGAPRPGGASLRPAERLFSSAVAGRRQSRRRVVFFGDRRRLFCTQDGAQGPDPRGSEPRPAISVVGIPDPLTWIRCKVQMSLIELYFDLDMDSEEFHRGIKQALVHVSEKMSAGRYHELRGLLSSEMMEYVEEKCRRLSAAQRKQLAVKMDDIIFVLPDEVSVVFDKFGRKFCSVVMRFWVVSCHDGPDDPEGVKIFRVTSGGDGGTQKRVSTAVYEFHRELTRGASDDWTVTTVWHYGWTVSQ